jgi:hypothetical protein
VLGLRRLPLLRPLPKLRPTVLAQETRRVLAFSVENLRRLAALMALELPECLAVLVLAVSAELELVLEPLGRQHRA